MEITTSTLGTKSVKLALPQDDAIVVSVFNSDGTLESLDLSTKHLADLVSLGLDLDPQGCEDGVPFLEVVVADDVRAWVDGVGISRPDLAEALANACVDAIEHTLERIEEATNETSKEA
jgi:hypothetical protein